MGITDDLLSSCVSDVTGFSCFAVNLPAATTLVAGTTVAL